MGADGRDGAVEGVGCADARETVNVCDCGARARLLRAVVRCGTRLSLVCVYSENLCFGIHVLYVGSHLKWNTLNTYSLCRTCRTRPPSRKEWDVGVGVEAVSSSASPELLSSSRAGAATIAISKQAR